MKFCNRPFRHVHLDPGGDVRVCSWTDECVGNILEENLQDIWHGDKVEKIRASILDGSYRYCRAISCPYLENDSLPNIEGGALEDEIQVAEVPESYNVACDFTCNHSCPSCRNEVFCGDSVYKQNLKIEIEKLIPYLNKAKYIVTCGNGDIFSSPVMMGMLERIHPENENCIIQFETNAALLDEEHWNKISHLGEYYLIITATPNSFDDVTFKYLNGGHDTLKKVVNNLNFVKGLKHKGIVNEIEISMVMQDRNFWELPQFVKRCIDEFEADKVTIKPLYKWFNLSADDYWHKDILNPLHPYHKEYLQMIEDPYLKDNDKVYFWGAKNLHPAQPHPAYRYKEYLELIARLMSVDDIEDKIRDYCINKNIMDMYIYGDMEISPIVYKILYRLVDLKGFIARDKINEDICGLKVVAMRDYSHKSTDNILVLNYQFFTNIKRDFDFKGFDGQLIKLDEMVNEIVKG